MPKTTKPKVTYKKPKKVSKFRQFVTKRAVPIIAVLFFASAGTIYTLINHAAPTWPTAPTVICGNTSYLNGPSTAPAGAVVVPAGDNESLTPGWAGGFSEPNKVFWFAPGVHTLGNGQYNQISPGDNSTYIGAPGAVIDGQNINESAFSGKAQGVTIKYLTIRNFVTPHDQGTVNHDAGYGWTISNNYMTMNNGAAAFAGPNNVLSYNCLDHNGQYGFQVVSTDDTPLTNILLDHNEISNNNTANTEATVGWEGCGCSGGGKFWAAKDVTVTNNYVHDNMGIGLWADTINVGFLFDGNWIQNNDGPGIMYEVSYNFAIKNNVFIHNGTVDGPGNPGFPTGAIYISESGSDSRVTSSVNNYNQISEISNNLIQDNWSGVVLWENSDRFCSNGLPTTDCTLVNPSVYTVASCQSALADPVKSQPGYNPDYFNDCRWQTKNVKIHDNTFRLNTANVAQCSASKACGINAIFSNYGVVYPYNNSKVDTNIAFNQGNNFYNNTYEGPWYFMGWAQSNQSYPLSFADWQKPVTDKCTTASEISSGDCNSGFGQDAGSSYNSTSSTMTGTGTGSTTTSDTSLPTVAFTSPTDGATVSGTVAVAASASDNVGVTKVEIKADGTLVASDTSAPYTYSWNTTTAVNGSHALSAIAYDAAGNSKTANIGVNVSNSTTTTTTLPAGNGLLATYFNNADFTGSTISRTDATINFNWGKGSPDPAIGGDTFSARWTGKVGAPYSGSYNFYTLSDDGVRLWVNGKLIIDNWTRHGATENVGSINLVGGQQYTIKMEYFESKGKAVAKLSWDYPGISKQVVPMRYLYTQ